MSLTKNHLLLVTVMLLLVAASILIMRKPYTYLKVGDRAPGFQAKAITSSGQTATLQSSDYQGRKLVLYFYPYNNTPYCTQQAKSLSESYSELQKQGYEVIGVSSNSLASHQRFREKYNIPFPLISDPTHTLQDSYGVWRRRFFFWGSTRRITFVIDAEGKIIQIIDKVKVGTHAAQILTGTTP